MRRARQAARRNVRWGLLLLLAIARPAASDEPIRVACVGDSITFGAGVAKRDENSYPAVLGRLLGPGYEVRNFGVNGATLLRNGDKPYWRQIAFHKAMDFQPQLVILKLGTNDTKPQNWKYEGDFEKDYSDLIDQFRGLPSKPQVWSCLPVPAYESRWGIDSDRVKDGVIPRIRKIAEARQVPVIDLYAALDGKPELFPDKIHPNVEGAALLAQAVHAALAGSGKADPKPAGAHDPKCCRDMMHTMEVKTCRACGKEGASCKLCPACAGASGRCPHCLRPMR